MKYITRIPAAGRITIPRTLRYGIEWVELVRREDGVIEIRPIDPVQNRVQGLLSRFLPPKTEPVSPVAVATKLFDLKG